MEIDEEIKQLVKISDTIRQKIAADIERKNQEKWMKLSSKAIGWLLAYDIFLFVLGLLTSIGVIIVVNLKLYHHYIILTLIGSFGTCLVGSSIYYIRKIYKSCIQVKFSTPEKTDQDKLQRIGTIVYFVFRPIFAIGFVVLVVLAIEVGIVSMAKTVDGISEGFINVCMFISFFIGFSTGNFISRVEKKSDSMVSDLLKTEGE